MSSRTFPNQLCLCHWQEPPAAMEDVASHCPIDPPTSEKNFEVDSTSKLILLQKQLQKQLRPTLILLQKQLQNLFLKLFLKLFLTLFFRKFVTKLSLIVFRLFSKKSHFFATSNFANFSTFFSSDCPSIFMFFRENACRNWNVFRCI